ncbi:unnamed protein product [Paramecium octaurelia]|uniref:Uncharacterized protein n=1 Tax=Paramecium octaurelia TaxID=43137 RepID=A0A8S1WK57_PAROT|nr:unnamed protein product [Paramecium octaurelia]
MNTISEINRCLQHLFHYSQQPPQPSCVMSMKSYYDHFINFDNYAMFEPQLFQFEDLNTSNFNEPPFLDFQFEEDLVLQNDEISQVEQENFKSSNLQKVPSMPNYNEQSQVALIQLRNFRQSINKEIQIKHVPLDIFTRQLTPKKSIPSLFDDETIVDVKQKQTQNYRPLRERIQEKLSQKQIDKKEQQVINNRFQNATQNSASRYHSKSPQSQFTKEFKQKFNSITPNQNLQLNLKQQHADQFASHQRSTSNSKTLSTPQKSNKEQYDSTVKIRIDIQNFQENHKKTTNQKQEKENKILTPIKNQSRINSQNFELVTKTKNFIRNQISKSPKTLSKSPIKTPEKEQCKYVVVNFYQKKY